jgi:hypothetical protein
MAAIYQLRDFPEHRDFVIRFCNVQSKNIDGHDTSAQILIDEMDATRKFLERI